MATNASETSAPASIHRWQISLNVLIQILAVIVIIIAINIISYRHFKRWDYSSDHQYALSSQTKNVLASLPKPVHAIVYFSTEAGLINDLNNLLREYNYAADSKFKIEAVDPYRNPARAQELKDKYKIQERDNIVILDYEGRNKFVEAADMVEMETPDQMQSMMGAQPRIKSFKGEGAITGALMELVAGKPNRVYLVTGHGEAELKPDNFQAITELLKRQNIQTASVNLLNAGKVPEDARSLLIYGPKYDLSELEIKLIDEFWEKKGSALVFLNPYAKTPRLTEWLSKQGIVPEDDQVIGTANFVSMNPDTGLPSFTKGTSTEAAFVIPQPTASPVTKDLAGDTGRFIGATQSLVLDQEQARSNHLRLNLLIQAAEGFWGKVDRSGDLSKAFYDPKKDHDGTASPLVLAASAEKGGVEDPRVKVEESRLIVVGNAELLGDNEYRQSQGVTGDFAINSLNWLLSHDESIGIPAKEKKTITVTLSPKQLSNIALIVVAGVPGLAALFGLCICFIRRS